MDELDYYLADILNKELGITNTKTEIVLVYDPNGNRVIGSKKYRAEERVDYSWYVQRIKKNTNVIEVYGSNGRTRRSQFLAYLKGRPENIDINVVDMFIERITDFRGILCEYITMAHPIEEVVYALLPHTMEAEFDNIFYKILSYNVSQALLETIFEKVTETHACYYKMLFNNIQYPHDFYVRVLDKLSEPDHDFINFIYNYRKGNHKKEYIVLMSERITSGEFRIGVFFRAISFGFPEEALCNIADFIVDDTLEDYLFYFDDYCYCDEYFICRKCSLCEYYTENASELVKTRDDLYNHVVGYYNEFAKKLGCKKNGWKTVKTDKPPKVPELHQEYYDDF